MRLHIVLNFILNFIYDKMNFFNFWKQKKQSSKRIYKLVKNKSKVNKYNQTRTRRFVFVTWKSLWTLFGYA
jgi:hypothetical protein